MVSLDKAVVARLKRGEHHYEVLEKEFKEGMGEDAAIQLGLKALHAGTDGKFNPDALEIAAVVDSTGHGQGGFRLLSADEVKAAVQQSQGKGGKE